jgi:hypothetical protein
MGPAILFIGKQLEMGNKHFNISLQCYIGKPQTLHNTSYWLNLYHGGDIMGGNYHDFHPLIRINSWKILG